MDSVAPPLPRQALEALEKGHLIEAIKHVREAKGLGLKESKDTVEAYLKAHPALGQRYTAASMEKNAPILKWTSIIVITAIISFVILRFLK